MSEVRIVATGLGFPEGPVVMPDGSVILTEIRNNRCSRITPDGKVSLFSATGGGPNGLAVGPDGALYCCNNGGSRYVEGVSMGQGPHPDYKSGSIQRIDRTTGAATTLYTECNGHKLSAPNDLVFDKAGGMYFTDLGKRYARHRDHGGLYYALPDGSKIVCLAYPMLSPNGCGLSPDGKVLYAADTEGARLWAFDVEGPGVLRKPTGHAPHGGRTIAGLGGRALARAAENGLEIAPPGDAAAQTAAPRLGNFQRIEHGVEQAGVADPRHERAAPRGDRRLHGEREYLRVSRFGVAAAETLETGLRLLAAPACASAEHRAKIGIFGDSAGLVGIQIGAADGDRIFRP